MTPAARRVLDEAGWRSDMESVPYGVPVLLWKGDTKEHYTAARVTGEHGPGWCTPDGYQIFRPTAWKPLDTPSTPSPLHALCEEQDKVLSEFVAWHDKAGPWTDEANDYLNDDGWDDLDVIADKARTLTGGDHAD